MATERKLQFGIRAATAEDLPACLALDHSSTSDYVWQIETEESQGRTSYVFRTVRLPRTMTVMYPLGHEAVLAAWQRRDYFLVAEHEGTIYGYLVIRPDHAHSIGWIEGLVVGRAWRRRGIGSALLGHARQWAGANNLRRLMIETQTKNYAAITFCQRQGFVFCGFNDRYYLNQDIALFFNQNIR